MEALDSLAPIHRLSVEQFHRMIAAGVFGDGDRLELIDGEMRDMTPIGPLHGNSTDQFTMLFATKLSDVATIRVQGALELEDDTEVYPDLMVLRRREGGYRTTNNAPGRT